MWDQALSRLSDGGHRLPDIVDYTQAVAKTSWRISWEIYRETAGRRVQQDIVFWGAVAACHGRNCRWQITLELLQWLPIHGLRPNRVLQNVAVSAASAWLVACHLVSSYGKDNGSDPCAPNVISYSSAISSCGRNWRSAAQLFSSMLTALVEASIITWNALVSSSQWQQALMYLEQMQAKRVSADIITFNAVVNACENQAWEIALTLLCSLKERRLQANLITWNSCLSACESSSAWEAAAVLLWGAPDCDVCSLNTAMSACASAGLWQRIGELLNSVGIEYDTVTYNAAIAGAQRSEQWPLALEFMTMAEPSVISYNASLSACGTSQWQTASQLLKEMEENQLEADEVSTSSIVTALSGQWRLATAAADEGRGSVQCLGALLRGSGRLNWTWNLQLLEAAGDITIYEALLATAIQQGDVSPCPKILEAVEEMARCVERTKQIRRHEQRRLGLDTTGILTGRTALCPPRWREAQNLLHHLKEKSLEGDLIAFNRGITSCEKATAWPAALGLLQLVAEEELEKNRGAVGARWRQAAWQVEKIFEADLITYDALMSACQKGDQWSRSLQLFVELKMHGLKPEARRISS
eukprot:s285_g19.t1